MQVALSGPDKADFAIRASPVSYNAATGSFSVFPPDSRLRPLFGFCRIDIRNDLADQPFRRLGSLAGLPSQPHKVARRPSGRIPKLSSLASLPQAGKAVHLRREPILLSKTVLLRHVASRRSRRIPVLAAVVRQLRAVHPETDCATGRLQLQKIAESENAETATFNRNRRRKPDKRLRSFREVCTRLSRSFTSGSERTCRIGEGASGRVCGIGEKRKKSPPQKISGPSPSVTAGACRLQLHKK